MKVPTNEILDVSAQIIAETATTYYKESFRRKGFDGRPWKPPKRPKSKGSLLVDSSALMNSIRPAVVTNERVVISAGNDKVTYAKAHNEGFFGHYLMKKKVQIEGKKEMQKPNSIRPTL